MEISNIKQQSNIQYRNKKIKLNENKRKLEPSVKIHYANSPSQNSIMK